jgi:hypothetical protein
MTEQLVGSNSGKIRRILVGTSAAILIAAITGFFYWFFTCPCERMPGGYLLGEESQQRIDNWSFANQVELCQIQISGILPHSINLNCMATDTGELYLSCSQCEGKYWSSTVQKNPRARIKLDGIVYPVTVRRVQEPDEMDNAWVARIQKLQQVGGAGNPSVPVGTPRAQGWWTFQVVSAL